MVNSSSSKGSLVAQSLAVSPHGAVQQGALFLSVGHLYITIVFAMAPQGALQVAEDVQPQVHWRLCVFCLDMIYSPVTLYWNRSITFSVFVEKCFLILGVSDGWHLLNHAVPSPRPSSARALTHSGIATDCPCCVTEGRLHPAPLFHTNAEISICASSLAFHPELTPLPWHEAHKTNAGWAS